MTRRHAVACRPAKTCYDQRQRYQCALSLVAFSHFIGRIEAAMTAATRLIPLHLRTDINATLARLRIARTVGDEGEVRASERRLNWLLEKISAQETM